MPNATNFGVEVEFFGIDGSDVVWSLRKAGVPIREDGYHHEERPYWRLTNDGSVSREGHELVSPILQHNLSGRAEASKAVRTLKNAGATIDRTCGLHVHHDAAHIVSPAQLANILGVYAYFQGTLDSIMPPSRRGSANDYCSSIMRSNVEWVEDQSGMDMGTFRNETSYGWNRYTNVNLCALRAHGTIEFRQHSGTLNNKKVDAWVRLTKLLMLRADQSWRDIDGPDSLENLASVLGMSSSLREFYKERQAALNARPLTDSEDQASEYEQGSYNYDCCEDSGGYCEECNPYDCSNCSDEGTIYAGMQNGAAYYAPCPHCQPTRDVDAVEQNRFMPACQAHRLGGCTQCGWCQECYTFHNGRVATN